MARSPRYRPSLHPAIRTIAERVAEEKGMSVHDVITKWVEDGGSYSVQDFAGRLRHEKQRLAGEANPAQTDLFPNNSS